MVKTYGRIIIIGVSLFLVSVTSLALYNDLNPPRKAWIFGDVYNAHSYAGTEVRLSAVELSGFPTLKAYIEYIEWSWITPNPSWNISSAEASSLLSLVRERSSQGLYQWSYNPSYEVYSFIVDVSGKMYGMSISFGERPILD
jgi:hypothetical protein